MTITFVLTVSFYDHNINIIYSITGSSKESYVVGHEQGMSKFSATGRGTPTSHSAGKTLV